MSDPLPEPKASSVVKCEKHGLHYDSSKMSGCVICRREAGGGSVAPPRAGAAADSGSVGQALAVTAVLLILTTAALFFTHGFLAEAFQSVSRPEARAFDEDLDRQMQELGLPSDEQDGAAGPQDYGGEDGAEGD